MVGATKKRKRIADKPAVLDAMPGMFEIVDVDELEGDPFVSAEQAVGLELEKTEAVRGRKPRIVRGKKIQA